MFGFIVWDPPKEMFSWNLPLLDRPILWYGFFFAIGFFLAYFFLVYLLRRYLCQMCFLSKKEGKIKAKALAEKILVYAVFGTVIGARLGDVLFYQDWSLIQQDPLSILKLWEGGLASHGGAVGVLIAFFFLFRKIKKEYPFLSFLRWMDLLCIPIALVACCIRLGNFINQEILGTCTQLFWAVVFVHPADGSPVCPRHPVQLYEAFVYLATFFFLAKIVLKERENVFFPPEGRIFAFFLLMVFGFRFLVEGVKVEQSVWISSSVLTMGQWLSIPFILLGFFLLFKSLQGCKRL